MWWLITIVITFWCWDLISQKKKKKKKSKKLLVDIEYDIRLKLNRKDVLIKFIIIYTIYQNDVFARFNRFNRI